MFGAAISPAEDRRIVESNRPSQVTASAYRLHRERKKVGHTTFPYPVFRRGLDKLAQDIKPYANLQFNSSSPPPSPDKKELEKEPFFLAALILHYSSTQRGNY